MQLETDSGLVINSPSNEDIERALRSEGFAFVWDGSDACTYLQFAKKKVAPWDFVLEYQINSLDDHFRAIDSPLGIDDIIAAFQNYAAGGQDWKTRFRWERMFLR